ncbi:tannase and feruloyl esterase [Tothia fuscella]|uniref:Carboxylic ester hydrolase n=1 Tax=Tothia fuscella TaxID=1048955 RepID=A0A9P4U0P6_9PEZI|nr:tannase and feruloyl esterase [Tothia fuscella]
MWFEKVQLKILRFSFDVIHATSSVADQFEQDCASLAAKQSFTITTIFFSQYAAAGSNIIVQAMGPTTLKIPGNICRIGAYAATSNRSGINFETWLPRNWTGSFVSHGNGGLSGSIDYSSLAYTSSNGFAAVSANSGHNGSSGITMYQNPDVVADFVWRSVHTGAVVGKEMTKAFYGRPHTKSYYLGYSTGGRQGWRAVQNNPEDFDGVVARAPAFAFNNLTSWSGNFLHITGPPGSSTFVSKTLWDEVILKDIMKQCDSLDDFVDGIIEDPSLCKYDPQSLLCKADQKSGCLTEPQVNTVRKTHSSLLQKDGSLIYPRMQPGAEYGGLFGGRVFDTTKEWYRYVIKGDPKWDPATITLDDMALAANINPANAETWEGDLSAFKARAGRVLHYHGLIDNLISSDNSARYYGHVLKTLITTPAQLDEFYRYFRISGIGHCGGGPGAGAIGQGGNVPATSEPESNVLKSTVRWVEEGKAPEYILGTRFAGTGGSAKISFQRRHRKYPRRNQYKGTGDANKADSWQKCKLARGA